MKVLVTTDKYVTVIIWFFFQYSVKRNINDGATRGGSHLKIYSV